MTIDHQVNGDEETILNSHPFIPVEGIPNFRDIGGYSSLTRPGSQVRKGLVFRSGETSRVTEKGIETLKSLGIRKVFDLRSDFEIMKYKSPALKVDGIDTERLGAIEQVWYDPVSLELRLQGYANDELNTFVTWYGQMIQDFALSFEKILRHIALYPDQPCLVHCSAGKDRTGMFTALLLMLLGVSNEDIANDYGLTTIGLKSLFSTLMDRFKDQAIFKDNWEGTLNMGRSKPENMKATIAHIVNEYGGAEGYFIKMTSLEAELLEKVKVALLR